jgi:hypothetical protein
MKKLFEKVIFFFIDVLALKEYKDKEKKEAKQDTLDELNKNYILTRGL